MKVNERFTIYERVMRRILMKIRSEHAFYKWLESRMRPSAELLKLKDSGRGRVCVIMGGGPSLKKEDPSLLRQVDCFGVNGIFLIQDWLGFLPKYYVVEDYWVVEDRAREIGELVGPTKFYSPLYCDKIASRGGVVFTNFLFDYSGYENFPEFSKDAARCVWVGGTVSYVCLQLAYYMGYDEVYLVGFDHNYQKPAHVTSDHVNWTSHGEDPNHFHPDYFGPGKRWHDPKIENMERAYLRAKREYEEVGRRIVNCTSGGHLNIFERGMLADCLRRRT